MRCSYGCALSASTYSIYWSQPVARKSLKILVTTEEKVPAVELAEYYVAKLHLELCRVPIKMPLPTSSIKEK